MAFRRKRMMFGNDRIPGRKLLAVLVFVAGLGFAGYLGFPWIADVAFDLVCPEGTRASACAVPLRAQGHWWARRGNLSEAGRWYLRSAGTGDPEAMFHLAWVYQETALTLHREEVQRRLYDQIGAALESPAPSGASAAVLQADRRKYAGYAVDWYRKSAEAGFPAGMNNLGLMYSLGLDAPPNHKEAFRWYLAAARAGNPIGSMNLMLTYLFGRGTARNPAEADKWAVWRPDNGLTDDLKSPALDRTLLWGVPERPAKIQDRIRFAARTGEPLKLTVSPLSRGNARIPEK